MYRMGCYTVIEHLSDNYFRFYGNFVDVYTIYFIPAKKDLIELVWTDSNLFYLNRKNNAHVMPLCYCYHGNSQDYSLLF